MERFEKFREWLAATGKVFNGDVRSLDLSGCRLFRIKVGNLTVMFGPFKNDEIPQEFQNLLCNRDGKRDVGV